MIKSMTGFGKGEFADQKRHITVEIRSVNHRYSDINVKMPRRYSFAEDKIKRIVKETVSRGKMEVSIMVENITEDDINVKLNTMVARQYVDNLTELKNTFGLDGEIDLKLLSSLPDVMRAIPDVEDEEDMALAIEKALREALVRYNLEQQECRHRLGYEQNPVEKIIGRGTIGIGSVIFSFQENPIGNLVALSMQL